MTILTHRLLDAQSRPVVGQEAAVSIYDPLLRPQRGVYQRTKAVIAVSDSDGNLSWTLPLGSRQAVPSYAVNGIEDGKTVLVAVPLNVSTASVTETRIGYLSGDYSPPATADLVTESELAAKLAGVVASGLTPNLVDGVLPQRLSDASLKAASLAAGKTVFTPLVPAFSKRRLALDARVAAPFDILGLGDSLFAGPQGVSSQRARWPMRMMDRLRSRLPVPGVPGGFGYIPCTTPSWTLSGNQSSSTTFGLSRQGRSLGADTGSGVGTAAITIPVSTSFTLVMQRGSTDTFTITVDGGAPTAIPLATSGLWTWNSGQLTRGTHTISIARTAGVPTVLGVMTFDGDETSGIRYWDGAQSGSRADSFNAADGGNSTWAENIGSIVTPSVVMIEWMTNDAAATTGRTPAQYQTSLTNILTLVRSKTAAPVLWVAPYQRAGGIQSTWDQYVTAMKTVAATDPESSVVDMRDYTVPLTYPDTYGAMADSLHPTDKYANYLGTVLADHIIGKWAV